MKTDRSYLYIKRIFILNRLRICIFIENISIRCQILYLFNKEMSVMLLGTLECFRLLVNGTISFST